MKCYKIIKNDNRSLIVGEFTRTCNSTSGDDQWCDSTYDILPNMYSLKYELHKKTTALKNTLGIFCFKTLTHAKHYFNDYPVTAKLYECEGYNAKSLPDEILGSIISEANLSQYYNTHIPKDDRYKYFSVQRTPKSFICFESIKLLKEIIL